jgi:cobalamin biosynthesis Mg chelatase CobN
MVMAIKVSQATIDKIKKMGMSAALKSAPKADAEMSEALRRMYGQRRVDAAVKAASPTTTPRAVMSRTSSTVAKSSAPSAVSGKKVSASTAKKSTPAKSAGNGLPGVSRGKATSLGLSIGPKRTTASVSAENAKRMGISVAEYNRRLNAKKK